MPKVKKQKKVEEGAPSWMTSFADMTNLIMLFFILLYAMSETSQKQYETVIGVSFQGFGAQSGGQTVQPGKLLDLGNSIMSFPSMEKGKSLSQAKKLATSVFQPEVNTNKVRIKQDERGLIISMAGDFFFYPGSAEVNIEEAREPLRKMAMLTTQEELKTYRFRLEGHTDATPTDPGSPYPTNWELSAARSINILKYLVDFGASEMNFQVSGFADTVPLMSNDTAEGRAYNRRVDLVIVTEGHL